MQQLDKNNKELTLRLDNVISNNSDGAELLLSLYKYQGLEKGDVLIFSIKDFKIEKDWHEIHYEYTDDESFYMFIGEFLHKCKKRKLEAYFSIGIYQKINGEVYRRWGYINSKTRLINVDIDEGDYTKSPFRPLLIWNSSPNSKQGIYDVGPSESGAEYYKKASGLVKTLKLKSKVDCGDSSRVLRIPGSYNHKPKHEDKHGNYPKVGNVRFIDLEPIGDCPLDSSSPFEGEETPKNIKPISIENLADSIEVDKKDLEKIINRNRKEYGDGTKHQMIYSLVGDLIGIGCNLRQICRLIEYLYQKRTLWYINEKFEEERKNNERQRNAFITRNYNALIETSLESNVTNKKTKEKVETIMDRYSEEYGGAWIEDELEEIDFDVEYESVNFLIRDLLPKGVIALLTGRSKTMKSTIARILAVILGGTVGKDYIGHRLEENTNVLFISGEESKNEISYFTSATYRGFGMDKDSKNNKIYSQYVTKDLSLNAPVGEIDKIVNLVNEKNIGLIIMDPISKLFSDIIDTKTTKIYTSVLQDIRDRTGATILIINHNNKMNEGRDVASRTGGNKGWFNFAQCILEVKKPNIEIDEDEENKRNNMTYEELENYLNETMGGTFYIKKEEIRGDYWKQPYFSINIERKFEGRKVTSIHATGVIIGQDDYNELDKEQREYRKNRGIEKANEIIDNITRAFQGSIDKINSNYLLEIAKRSGYDKFNKDICPILIEEGFIKEGREGKKKIYIYLKDKNEILGKISEFRK